MEISRVGMVSLCYLAWNLFFFFFFFFFELYDRGLLLLL